MLARRVSRIPSDPDHKMAWVLLVRGVSGERHLPIDKFAHICHFGNISIRMLISFTRQSHPEPLDLAARQKGEPRGSGHRTGSC
jgi:hypothetical protein